MLIQKSWLPHFKTCSSQNTSFTHRDLFISHQYFSTIWTTSNLSLVSTIAADFTETEIALLSTPSPWFVRFSLVRFPFVHNFKRVPRCFVHADFPLIDRVNPSFVRKLVTVCNIDFINVFLVCADYF